MTPQQKIYFAVVSLFCPILALAAPNTYNKVPQETKSFGNYKITEVVDILEKIITPRGEFESTSKFEDRIDNSVSNVTVKKHKITDAFVFSIPVEKYKEHMSYEYNADTQILKVTNTAISVSGSPYGSKRIEFVTVTETSKTKDDFGTTHLFEDKKCLAADFSAMGFTNGFNNSMKGNVVISLPMNIEIPMLPNIAEKTINKLKVMYVVYIKKPYLIKQQYLINSGGFKVHVDLKCISVDIDDIILYSGDSGEVLYQYKKE